MCMVNTCIVLSKSCAAAAVYSHFGIHCTFISNLILYQVQLRKCTPAPKHTTISSALGFVIFATFATFCYHCWCSTKKWYSPGLFVTFVTHSWPMTTMLCIFLILNFGMNLIFIFYLIFIVNFFTELPFRRYNVYVTMLQCCI